jgi:hypothetical protein
VRQSESKLITLLLIVPYSIAGTIIDRLSGKNIHRIKNISIGKSSISILRVFQSVTDNRLTKRMLRDISFFDINEDTTKATFTNYGLVGNIRKEGVGEAGGDSSIKFTKGSVIPVFGSNIRGDNDSFGTEVDMSSLGFNIEGVTVA